MFHAHVHRDAIQLEETLLSNENVEITAAKQAYAHASGKDELTGSGLAELRARHQARAPGLPIYIYIHIYICTTEK